MQTQQITLPTAAAQCPSSAGSPKTLYAVLLAISLSHLINDTIQSLVPAIYPTVKDAFRLSFTQVGLITLTFQLTASLLQPMVGLYTDRRPKPYSLAYGMGFTLAGLVFLSQAWSFATLIVSVALVGLGSAVFHPEASRLAHVAAGGRPGLAQSLFQVGGNAGSALGPLMAALIIANHNHHRILWFAVIALAGILVLSQLGRWYAGHMARPQRRSASASVRPLSRGRTILVLAILLTLMFSKYFYSASLSSYYTFYLIDKFQVSIQSAQIHLFVYLISAATGALIGGPIGDRIGRKYVIWFSILGVAPFTILLPYADLFWTRILTVLIGLVLSSAFSAILVYAQELVPGKVGMISGLFFGLAFGLGGVGSAVLGGLADHTSIGFVFQVCSFLPLIGLIAAFLPDLRGAKN